MTTDDLTLRVGLERLDIEPLKVIKNVKEENPFSNSLQKKYLPKAHIQSSKCNCIVQKKKNYSICKKKHTRLLREPVFKLHANSNMRNEFQQIFKDVSAHACTLPMLQSDHLCLHTLVDNCNQLSISAKRKQSYSKTNKSNSSVKCWNSHTANDRQSRDLSSERTTCSQQALHPPCDVTIDELASYFDTMVHIPKKMSSMAEMMYI